jgi:hypothetical protein
LRLIFIKQLQEKTAAMQVLSKYSQYKMVLENGQLIDGKSLGGLAGQRKIYRL